MLNLIKKLISTITLNKVALWVFAAGLSIVFYTAYENRNRMFSTLGERSVANPVGLTFSTSAVTEEFIRAQVTADRSIIGISIMSADLRLNEAKSIFFFGDDALLSRIDAESRRSNNNRLPLFTSIDESNAGVIRLINGQFHCSKFSDSVFSRIYPELNQSVKMVCRSSIPSYYGYFSGFISVYLGEDISPERQQALKLMTDKIATDIYFRDVIPTQKLEQTHQKYEFTP